MFYTLNHCSTNGEVHFLVYACKLATTDQVQPVVASQNFSKVQYTLISISPVPISFTATQFQQLWGMIQTQPWYTNNPKLSLYLESEWLSCSPVSNIIIGYTT